MSELKLTVESLESFETESREMARALDRGATRTNAARFAFESMDGLLRALTANRWALIRTLRRAGPSSIRALAHAVGRDYWAVHADVTALLATGLVERDTAGRIFMPWSRISAELELGSAT